MLGISDGDRTTDFCSSLLDKVRSLKLEDSRNERISYDSEISDQLTDIAQAIKNDRDKLEELIDGLHIDHISFIRILCCEKYMSETKVGEVCVDKLDKIIEFARSGDKSLELVLELLIALIRFDLFDPSTKYVGSVARRLPELLTLVLEKKELWLNENIMYYIIKILWIVYVWEDSVEASVRNRINDDGLMLRVCILLGQIYERKPQHLQVDRKVAYPDFLLLGKEYCEFEGCTVLLFFEALKAFGILPESRVILPIATSALQRFRKFMEPKLREGKSAVAEVLINILRSKNSEDHKDIVTSGAIVHLLASSIIPGPKEKPDGCHLSYNLLAVELFFSYHDRTHERTWTDPKALAEILPTLIAIIDSKTLLKEDLEYYVYTSYGTKQISSSCSSITNVTYAEAAIELAEHYISSKGQEVDQPILDSDFVHTLLRFVEDNEESKNYHSILSQVAGCLFILTGALVPGKSPNTGKILDPLKDDFFSRVAPIVTSNTFPNIHLEVLACVSVPGLLINMAMCENIDIMAIEIKSRIFLSYIMALKSSKRNSLLSPAASTLHCLINCRKTETRIISQYVLDHFPSIWKRIRSREMKQDSSFTWQSTILKLTTLISPDIEFAKINQLKDLECLMVDWVATQEDPWDIPSIRTCWGILLQNSRGPLARYLKKITKKKNEKGVFGLNYLIDVMVTYLDQDPAYSSEYMCSLTKFILETAKSDLPDSQSILLEDLVSPAMWLLGRVSDERIVENVTEFVRVLREG